MELRCIGLILYGDLTNALDSNERIEISIILKV